MKKAPLIFALIFSLLFTPTIFAQYDFGFTIRGEVYSIKDSLPISGISILPYYTTDSLGKFEIKGLIDQYKNTFWSKNGKLILKVVDKDTLRKVKYKSTDTIVEIADQLLKIYLFEEQ